MSTRKKARMQEVAEETRKPALTIVYDASWPNPNQPGLDGTETRIELSAKSYSALPCRSLQLAGSVLRLMLYWTKVSDTQGHICMIFISPLAMLHLQCEVEDCDSRKPSSSEADQAFSGSFNLRG